MNITFRIGSEILLQKSIDRAEAKLNKLARFIPKQESDVLVYVDIERESSAQQSERGWKASINLEVEGTLFNASTVGITPEAAIDSAIREMKQEVKRSQAKKGTIRKRGGDFLKRLSRGF